MVVLDEMLRRKEGFKGVIERGETIDLAEYAANVGDLMRIYCMLDSEQFKYHKASLGL